jgi:hypothetical protein
MTTISKTPLAKAIQMTQTRRMNPMLTFPWLWSL